MTILKGRAATPIRPGLTVKSILTGKTPLVTGEYVKEASITDLHQAYKELVSQENTLRPKAKRLKPMTGHSFKTLFRFAQLLHLVELVREEPMLFPPPGGGLLSIRGSGAEARIIASVRRVFRLTHTGEEDEKSWSDLNRAWREGWPAPQKLEYVAPPRKPRKPPVVPPAEERFRPFRLPRDPTIANFKLLLSHLRVLGSFDVEAADVADELRRLSLAINSWEIDIIDGLDDARAIGYTEEVHRLERWRDLVAQVRVGLEGKNIGESISALEGLISR